MPKHIEAEDAASSTNGMSKMCREGYFSQLSRRLTASLRSGTSPILWRYISRMSNRLISLIGEKVAETTAKGRAQLRGERLQIMLEADELVALDDFRFQNRLPSRAAAVRELLRRGLLASGAEIVHRGSGPSKTYGVLGRRNGAANGKLADQPVGSGHAAETDR